MKAFLYLKIGILIATLGGVIYVILNVNTESVSKFLHTMGIEAGAPGLQAANRAPQPGEVFFNICKTRVHAVIWPSGQKIEEARSGLKMTWQAHDPTPRELGYMAIEKWLSQHCQITVKPRTVVEGEALSFEPYLTLVYVDGSQMEISKAADQTFWLDKTKMVHSEDLLKAVDELIEIAQLSSEPKR